MAKYIGPKSKIARRFGEPIFGADKVLSKRNFPPGQHGNSRRRKQSEYAVMLAEKQKAKYTYGQNQAYWYQNVIDTFSTQLPELAYGNITAKEFCQKLTDAAKKN